MVKKINELPQEYRATHRWRGLKEWAFRIVTLGLGSFALKTSVVREGQLGLRCDSQGKMTILPPGRYHKFPWETYPVKPTDIISNVRETRFKPYKILIVEPGRVAGIYQNEELITYPAGRYVLEASEELCRTVELHEKTQSLDEFSVLTSDNTKLTINPTKVCYQITNPSKAMIKDIHRTVASKIELSISEIVKKISLNVFLPCAEDKHQQGESPGVVSISDILHNAVSKELYKIGIQLYSINLTWSVDDKYRLVRTQQNTVRRKISAEGQLAAMKILADGMRDDALTQGIYTAQKSSQAFFQNSSAVSAPTSIPTVPAKLARR